MLGGSAPEEAGFAPVAYPLATAAVVRAPIGVRGIAHAFVPHRDRTLCGRRLTRLTLWPGETFGADPAVERCRQCALMVGRQVPRPRES